MPKIVLSYRRADSAAVSGRIFDHLVAHYGKDAVFMDIDNIPYGDDFRVHIGEALEATDTLIVVVGPHWLDPDEETGVIRILEENDFVRVEIETALGKSIPVVPVLIDRTPMPKPAQLPESLKPFAFRNAADIDSGRDFQMHMERLLRSMDKSLAARRKTSTAVSPNPDARGSTIGLEPTAPQTDPGIAPQRNPRSTWTAKPEIGDPARTDTPGVETHSGHRTRSRSVIWLVGTLAPMWISYAMAKPSPEIFLSITAASALISGLVQSYAISRSTAQAVLFSAATGALWLPGLMILANVIYSVPFWVPRDIPEISAVAAAIAATVLLGHFIGSTIRQRRSSSIQK